MLPQTSLERELSELKREFLLMHNRTSKAVTLAFEALLEQNLDKAKRAIASDIEIDEWKTMLEKHCLEVIAKHQLLARDARFVTGVLSSVADFERAGDYATHIAEDAAFSVLKREHIQPVTDLILEMMRDLETGLRNENPTLASIVADRDNDVDRLTSLLNEALLERQHANQNDLVANLRVVRGLQRIGDHLENVAERIVFWINWPRVSGDDVPSRTRTPRKPC
jgi:phosphate transport system protein